LRLAVLAALAAACAGGDGVIDVTYDPCAPLGLDAAGDRRGDLEDAIGLWGLAGVVAGPVDGATIDVLFEAANPAMHGYYDDEAGVIYVNTALDADPAARAIVIAHELGHAFGLPHVDAAERASLMNPHNLSIGPTDEDAAALVALWGSCAP
jgi:hypothetical protein